MGRSTAPLFEEDTMKRVLLVAPEVEEQIAGLIQRLVRRKREGRNVTFVWAKTQQEALEAYNGGEDFDLVVMSGRVPASPQSLKEITLEDFNVRDLIRSILAGNPGQKILGISSAPSFIDMFREARCTHTSTKDPRDIAQIIIFVLGF